MNNREKRSFIQGFKKHPKLMGMIVVVTLMLGGALVVSACGTDGVSSCQNKGGTVCNNCSVDCNITCDAGKEEYCVGMTYFGDETQEDLRCTFCE
jgi:hypothetical protein